MIYDNNIYVLIACEESQAECIAFRHEGAIAYSCDIQLCRKGSHPEWHIPEDVTRFLDGDTEFITQNGEKHKVPGWDVIIAHPPCTYLCKVSAVQLRKNADHPVYFNGKETFVNYDRYRKMIQARKFFQHCLDAKAMFVAVENPLPMAIASLPPADCYIQPSWYGVKYTKKTLYWLRNLPPLMPEIEHPNPKSYVHCSRGKYRSRTFPEVADAMARQWMNYIRKVLGISD